MSRDVRERGTLTPINGDSETYAKAVCEEKGIKKESFHENYLELLMDEDWEHHCIINGSLYTVDCNEEDPYFCQAEELDNGKIIFDVTYYNGGCCMTEAIEDALKNGK